MASVKIPKSQRARVVELVAKYDRRGMTYAQIGRALVRHGFKQISAHAVMMYMNDVKENYRNAVVIESVEAIQIKLAQYRDVRNEAWLAYLKSKRDSSKIVLEKAPPWKDRDEDATKGKQGKRKDVDHELKVIKETVTREGRNPSAQYLSIIMQTLEAERELLGLDPKDEKGMTGPQTVVNIDIGALLAGVEAQRKGLVIEAKSNTESNEANDAKSS